MDFTSLATWFLLFGVAGTTFLALRTVALLLGGAIGGHDSGDAGGHGADHAGDAAADAAAHVGDGHVGDGQGGDGQGDGHDTDSDAHHDGTRWLTLQGLSAFAMGFGWLGFSLLPLVPAVVALAAAVLFGGACAAALGWVVSRLPRLEGSGTFRASGCVGQVGTVYRRIPADGQGAVQVEAQGRLVTMEATADQEILTGRRVLIYDVTAEHVVCVEPWDDGETKPAERARARRDQKGS